MASLFEDPLPEPQDPQPPAPRTAAQVDRIAFPTVPAAQVDPQGPPDARIVDEIAFGPENAVERYRKAVFEQAVKADPKLAAEAQKMGVQTGLDPQVVERNMAAVRQILHRRQLDAIENPILQQQLTDPAFARIAYDDLDNLKATAGLFSHFEAGAIGVELEELYNRQASGDTDPRIGPRIATIAHRLRQLPTPTGLVTGFLSTLGMLAQMVPEASAYGTAAVAATAAADLGPQAPLTAGTAFGVGFSTGMVMQLFRTGRGAAFRKMVEQGYDPDVAAMLSVPAGFSNAVLMGAGGGLIAQGLKPVAALLTKQTAQALVRPTVGTALLRFAGRSALGTGEMGLLSGAQQGVEVLMEEAARRLSPDADQLSSALTRGEAGQEILSAAEQGATSFAILASLGPALRLVGDLRVVTASQQALTSFARGAALAAEAKVRERSPEAYAKTVNAVDEATGGPRNVYVASEQFAQVLNDLPPEQRDLTLRNLPDVARQLEQPGVVDVVMPVADYYARVAGSPLDAALREHVRFIDPENMSAAEMKVLASTLQKRAAEAKKMLTEAEVTNKAFVDSAHRVEDQLLAQLREIHRLPTEQARAGAQMYRDLIVVAAAEAKQLPEEFHAQRGLTVKAGKAGEAPALHQPEGTIIGPDENAKTAAGVQDLRRSNPPSYGAAQEGGVSVVGVHFSREPRTSLSTAFYGTGLRGAERHRVAGDPLLSKRSYFYVDTGGGIQPEHGVGPHAHDVLLHNLYDTAKDPLGIVARWNAADVPDAAAVNGAEQEIIAKGFSGLYVKAARGQGVAVLLGPQHTDVPVRARIGADEPAAARSQPPEAGAVPEPGRVRGSSGLLAQSAGTHLGPDEALRGLPATVTVGGKEVAFGPLPRAREAAQAYAKAAGIDYRPPTSYAPLDTARGKRIADAYDAMKHDPTDPAVKRAYDALIAETLAQWQEIKKTGLKVEFIEGEDPYANNPRLAIQDIVNNNHWWAFPTDAGFGNVGDVVDVTDSPMLRVIEGETISGKPVRANDVFRIVHDYFGHAKEGVGFRARGEENAWQQHMALYSDEAQKAATTELRGQNSWVNFGPHGEQNQGKNAAETVYAPQKVGLLPDWVRTAGRVDELRQGGARGSYDPKTRTAFLFQKSNFSTFAHEMAHFALDMNVDLASREASSPQHRADIDTLMQWFKVKGETPEERLAAWRAMSLDEQRPHHEALATSFEHYLIDGKAPSLELRTVFAKMKRWVLLAYKGLRDSLNALYRQEHGVDLPVMTPQVRSVMDRMLASQEQIRQAEQVHAMVPHFLTEEAFVKAGNPAEEWQPYQQLQDERHQEAEADFTKRSLGDLKWLSGQQKGLLHERQQEHAAERARVQAEVQVDISQQKVHKARAILRGKVIDPETGETVKTAALKLHRQEAKNMVAGLLETESRNVPEGPTGEAFFIGAFAKLRGMLDDHGAPLDVAAGHLDYETGEQLVRDLISAPELKDAVEQATDERMLQEHSELADPVQRARAVEEALHGPAHTRFLATELKHMARAQQPLRMLVAAAKDAAKAIIEQMSVRRISVAAFSAAEKRASLEVEEALKTGDREAAFDAKRKQLVQSVLVSEAIRVEKEIDKALAGFAPVFRSDKKVAATRNVDIVGAARTILAAYGLGPKAALPLDYMELLRQNDPSYYAELAPEVLAAVRGNTLQDYRDLPLEHFRVLRDTVKDLWFRAKLANEVVAEGKKVTLRSASSELIDRWAETVKDFRGSVTGRQPNRIDRAAGKLLGLKAFVTQVEHWARYMDGGDASGPTTRYLARSVFTGTDAYLADKLTYVTRFRDMVKALKLTDGQIDAPELGYVFANKAELIAALLHTGNESNMRKMLLGMRRRGGSFSWGQLLADGSVDETPWWALRQRLMDRGVLTKQDFDFAQATWDLHEEIKPQIQAVMHAEYGHYMEPVEPRAQAAFGKEYAGGYVPAKPDREAAKRAGMQPPQQREGLKALDDMAGEFRRSTPGTGRGFTITRTGSTYPLVLDVRAEIMHLDQVLRFVHLQPAVRSVLRLLRDRDTASVLNQIDPTIIDDVLTPWLSRAARNSMTDYTKMPEAANLLFDGIRRNSGMAVMFAVPLNILTQTTSIVNSVNYVPALHLLNAAWRYLTDPEARQAPARLSKLIDQRANHQMGRLQDDVELALNPSTFSAAQRFTTRKAYYFQNAVWNIVDNVTWSGAFAHAMERLGKADDAQATAIAEADSAVRLSQGSNRPVDAAQFAEGTPFWRALTQFSSYSNTILNSLMYAHGGGAKAKAAALVMIVPALISGAIQKALWGGVNDKDQDGYSNEVAKWFFGAQLRSAFTMVPVVGPPLMSLLESGGDRLQISPSLSTVVAASQGAYATWQRYFGDDRKVAFTGRDVRDILTGLALVTGLPFAALGRPAQYQQDVNRGVVQPSSRADYLRGLMTGAASPGTR